LFSKIRNRLAQLDL